MQSTFLLLFALFLVHLVQPVPLERQYRDRRSAIKKTAWEIEEELEGLEDQIDDLKIKVRQSTKKTKNAQSSQQQIVRPGEIRDTVVETLAEYFHNKTFDKDTVKLLIENVAGQFQISLLEKEQFKAQLRSRLKVEETLSKGLKELVESIIEDIIRHNLEENEVESFIKLMVEQAALKEHWEEDETVRMLKLVRTAVHQGLQPDAGKLNPLSRHEMEALDDILGKKVRDKGLTQQESLLILKILHRALSFPSLESRTTEATPTNKASSVKVLVEKLKEPKQDSPIDEKELNKQPSKEEEIEVTVEKITPQTETETENAATEKNLQSALKKLEKQQTDALIKKNEESLERELEMEPQGTQVEKISQSKESTVQVERIDSVKQPYKEERVEVIVEKLKTPHEESATKPVTEMENEEQELEGDSKLKTRMTQEETLTQQDDEPNESTAKDDEIDAVKQSNQEQKFEVGVDKERGAPVEVKEKAPHAATKEENLQAALAKFEEKQKDHMVDKDEDALLESELELETQGEPFELKQQEKQTKVSTVQVERIDPIKQPNEEEKVEVTVEKITTPQKKPAPEGPEKETISVENLSQEEKEILQAAIDDSVIENEEKALEGEQPLELETQTVQVDKLTQQGVQPIESTEKVEKIDIVKQPNQDGKVEVTVEKITKPADKETISVRKHSSEEEDILRAAMDDSLIEQDENSLEGVEELPQSKESTIQVERIDAKENEWEDFQAPVEEIDEQQESDLDKEEQALEDELETVKVQVEKLTQPEDNLKESTIQVERIDAAKQEEKKNTAVKLQDSLETDESELETREIKIEKIPQVTEPQVKTSQIKPTEEHKTAVVIVEKITSPPKETRKPAETTTVATPTSVEGTDENELETDEKVTGKQKEEPGEEIQDELALEELELKREREAKKKTTAISTPEENTQDSSAKAKKLLNKLNEPSYDTSTDEEIVNNEQIAKEFENALELERNKQEQVHPLRTTSPSSTEVKTEFTTPTTELIHKENTDKSTVEASISNRKAIELENELEGISIDNTKQDSTNDEPELEKTENPVKVTPTVQPKTTQTSETDEQIEKGPSRSKVTLSPEETQQLKEELQQELQEEQKSTKPASKVSVVSVTKLTKSQGVHSLEDLVKEVESKEQVHVQKVTHVSESRDKELQRELDELAGF